MSTLRPQLRAATGAISGLAATAAMDKAGTIFWECAMDAETQAEERRIEPKCPLTVLAEGIARRLNLAPGSSRHARDRRIRVLRGRPGCVAERVPVANACARDDRARDLRA